MTGLKGSSRLYPIYFARKNFSTFSKRFLGLNGLAM